MHGARLREARLNKGLSQAGLGRLAGVGKSAVSQYENNARTPDGEVLVRLAAALDTSTDWLLGRDEYFQARDGRTEYGGHQIAPGENDFLSTLIFRARAINDPGDRRALLALAVALAEKEST